MIQIALGLVSIISAIVSWLHEKGQMDQAKAALMAGALQGVLDDIQKANAVRDAVRDDLAAHPDKLRDPDPNSRD